MAQDCYQVFKTTYTKAVNDGLGTAVATAAAQSAMENCLSQQSLQVPTVQPIVTVPGSVPNDPGPKVGPTDRATRLGNKGKV